MRGFGAGDVESLVDMHLLMRLPNSSFARLNLNIWTKNHSLHINYIYYNTLQEYLDTSCLSIDRSFPSALRDSPKVYLCSISRFRHKHIF